MAVTATRSVSIGVSGEGFNANNVYPAASNTTSPARVDYLILAAGTTTVSTTTGVVSATILPPSTNTNSITVKGTTGDTGIRIHNTDPTSIGLDSSVSSFCLTVATTTSGVRIVWT